MHPQYPARPRAGVRRRAALAGMAAMMLASVGVMGAGASSADSIWVQSFQRSSQSEECLAPEWETPWQSSWGSDSSWKPSYEMWANEGTGGWVCTRSITWARTPTAGGAIPAGGYSVGDVGPAGGTIFYVAPSQQSWGRYLEAAPSDDTTFTGKWCDTSADVPGALGTAIGTGSANTQAMDAACSSGAGQAAADYSNGGFDDWFLPSLDELNAMCKWAFNDQVGVLCNAPDYLLSPVNGGFTGDWYWSSTQFTASGPATADAWAQRFSNGVQDRFLKSSVATFKVRPIRAF